MSKEAMKLALDALDEFCELGAIIRPLEVRDALREALAEQPAQQEPVYFCDYGYEGWGKVDAAMAAENRACGMTVEAYYTSPPAQQEPVAVVSGYYGGRCVILPIDHARIFNLNTALYTSQPQRKPLTDEELVDVASNCGMNGLNINGYTFARAIEAAHGIGEKK